jgi:hypothetical protein
MPLESNQRPDSSEPSVLPTELVVFYLKYQRFSRWFTLTWRISTKFIRFVINLSVHSTHC